MFRIDTAINIFQSLRLPDPIIPDGFQQNVFQGTILEHFTQDIEHPASKVCSLNLQLIKKTLENITFPCFQGDHIPQIASLCLTNSMNTAKSLLDPIRVPRQIVVDHQIGVLKVDTFASRVCRDQEANRRIVSEFVLDLQPFLAGNGTMDTADAVRLPCQGADFLLQIKECVLMLCEDNELLIEKQILAFEQLRKTAPLAVFVIERQTL